ncbi:MAG TPA: DUF4434 domain-containing protein [Candidatus Riflebacteria bacterium]|jgi:hypothetical protein|nr:DUF4434 domain-containing protein [Candidatus Riflebacteria bacterium]
MNGITGTFLDEITHDIPSQNWGAREWAADFDAMQAIGIDTVILIRAGYRDRATFDSKALKHSQNMLPAYIDLFDLFLTQAERCGMQFFFGTYDSGKHWINGDYQAEADLNKHFCDEVAARYGHRKAFSGWYISHEINTYNDGMMKVYLDLSAHLRGLKKLPILISPYVKGVKQFAGEAIDLTSHIREWEMVFQALRGHVDIVAFQDGQIDYRELPDYLRANGRLAAACGIETWSNVECFDRDMPIKFPPIDFRCLRYKIEQASAAGVSKLITFEFSHFMSPNSCYLAARNLYQRYQEWLASL